MGLSWVEGLGWVVFFFRFWVRVGWVGLGRGGWDWILGLGLGGCGWVLALAGGSALQNRDVGAFSLRAPKSGLKCIFDCCRSAGLRPQGCGPAAPGAGPRKM